MKRSSTLQCIFLVLFSTLFGFNGYTQCGPNVPSFVVDLSSSPSAAFTSPWVQRLDNCCGSTAPDVCVEFVLTLHPMAQGITFDVCDGAVSGGSMFYQVGCGPVIAVGQPVCLNGPGPHYMTFCKPGNNTNVYCITSLPSPSAGPDIGINDGCTGDLTSNGFAPGTVQWTSIFPGPIGSYNSYLGCSTCENTTVDAQPGFPAYIDYQVCGNALSPCSSVVYCDTLRVEFFPELTVDIFPPSPVVCNGGPGVTLTANVTGGTAPYTYLWNTGEVTQSIWVSTPGNYEVLVADISGCPPTQSVINVGGVSLPFVVNAGSDQVICNGISSVQLSGAVNGATGGVWSNGSGQFLPSANSLNATYQPTSGEVLAGFVILTLTTTGTGGCPPESDDIAITFSNSFQGGSLTALDANCSDSNDGSLTYQPALPGMTYQWNDPAAQTTNPAVNLSSGTYTVTVTDINGCDTTLSMYIEEPPALNIDAIQTVMPTCFGVNNGLATASVSGGTPGYTYQWSNNTGGQTLSSAVNLGDGTYIVVVTDDNGCIAQETTTLISPSEIILTANVPDTVCINDPIVLSAQASGGTGGILIEWLGIGFGESLVYSFPTDQNVTVSATDANGCSSPSLVLPVNVLDLQSGTLEAYGDTMVCEDGVATVHAELFDYPATVFYTWPQLGFSGPGPHTVAVQNDQVLQVIVTDGCASVLEEEVELLVEEPMTIELPEIIAEGCDPLSVQFPSGLVTGATTYNWQLGDGSNSNIMAPLHTYSTGSYAVWLTATSAIGCTAISSNSGSVIVHSNPIADFSASPWSTNIENANIQFSNTSSSAISLFDWNFGDGSWSDLQNPQHTYTNAGIFSVELWVQDQNGCESSITRTVEITPIYDITIPNVFTPDPNGSNGGYYDAQDLSNDVFYPFVEHVEDFNMRIYNRWGELIFESKDISIGWDGYYRGQLSPQDAYVYQVWVRFIDGKEEVRTGDVTLMR